MIFLSVLLGAVLLYLLQNYLYKRYWNYGLEISLALSSATAFEGDDKIISITVVNRKVLPLPALKVKFRTASALLFEDDNNSKITDHYYRSDLLSVMMFQKLERSLKFNCSKRGYYFFSDLTCVCSNLFLTSELISSFDTRNFLYVFPKEVSAERFDPIFRKLFGTILTKRLINEDPFEFRAIREYQPFDTMNTINWKASAKSGELMVNSHNYTSSVQVHLYLNLERISLLQHDDIMEESIRLASAFASSLIHQGIPVSLTTNGIDITTKMTSYLQEGSGPGHIESVREILARIDLTQSPPPFVPLCSKNLQTSSSQEYCLLISSYQRQDLQDILAEMTAARKDFLWIIPYSKYAPLEEIHGLEDFIIPWNVSV